MTQRGLENEFLNQFAQETDNIDVKNTNYDLTGKEDDLSPYLIYEDARGMRLFKTAAGLLLYIQILILSFQLSLDTCIILNYHTFTFSVLVVAEVCFLADFILNFVTIPTKMKSPALRYTASHYLKKMFLVDFPATILSNILIIACT